MGKTLTERSSRWLITTYCVLGLDRSLQQPLYIVHWLRMITFKYFKRIYAHTFKKYIILIYIIVQLMQAVDNLLYKRDEKILHSILYYLTL